MKMSYTIKEIADYMGCSQYMAQKMIDSSDIPVYMVGKQKRVMVKDFEVFLKGGRAYGINT